MSRARNELPKNLLNRLAAYRQVLLANIDPALSTPSRGKVISPGGLVAAIEAFFALCAAAQAAQLAFQNSLLARSRGVPGALALAEQCKEYLAAVLGGGHPVMRQRFLRGPGGKHEISAETHVAAAEARRQTRQRRKTMGKRQRAKIKAR